MIHILKKMKKTLLILSILLIISLAGCAQVGKNLGVSLSSTSEKMEIRQEAYKDIHGKYEHIKKTTEGNLTQQVIEYITPKGKRGYQVIETEKREDGNYLRSYGKGAESKLRSFDWILTSIATSTE